MAGKKSKDQAKGEKNLGGRPPLNLDGGSITYMASIGCPANEIAEFFACSPQTIYRKYKNEYRAGRASHKTSIRQRQYEVAMSGQVAMLIFLGKQVLGQRDDMDPESEPESAGKLVITERIVSSPETNGKPVEANGSANGSNGTARGASRIPGQN